MTEAEVIIPIPSRPLIIQHIERLLIVFVVSDLNANPYVSHALLAHP